jgi:hypothetical protein
MAFEWRGLRTMNSDGKEHRIWSYTGLGSRLSLQQQAEQPQASHLTP